MISSKRACYGIPTVFSFASKTCSTCDSFGECRRLSHDALKTVPVSPAILDALVDHERAEPVPATASVPIETAAAKPRSSRAKHRCLELTAEQREVIASVPIKVGEFLEKLFKRGHDAEIRIALRTGVKPLASVPGYRSLKLALDKLHAGFDRTTLRVCLENSLGWSYRSAMSEVTMIWGVLPALGVGVERNGRMVVSPKVIAKNS